MNMWYRGSLRSIPLHKATQKGDGVEVAALLAQVSQKLMVCIWGMLQSCSRVCRYQPTMQPL